MSEYCLVKQFDSFTGCYFSQNSQIWHSYTISPCSWFEPIPDSKVHGANMGPTWVLSAPGGPHVGLMNLAIRDVIAMLLSGWCGKLCQNRSHSFDWIAGTIKQNMWRWCQNFSNITLYLLLNKVLLPHLDFIMVFRLCNFILCRTYYILGTWVLTYITLIIFHCDIQIPA